MEIHIKRIEEYIPKFNDNDKSDKPVIFKLKYLTTAEANDCVILKAKRSKKEADELSANREKMFKYSVIEISNLAIVDEDGKKTEIKSAEDLLLNPGLEGYFAEVWVHITNMDARVDPKN